MRSLLFRAKSSVWVQVQLTKLRRLHARWIDLPSQRLERARRQLRRGDVDLLILGDSSTLCWSFHDTDRTLLPEMLAERLGPNIAAVSGPGFGARIYSEVLRILTTMEERPRALVIAMAVRATTGVHIVQNPLSSYRHSIIALKKVPNAKRRIRSLGRGGIRFTDEEQKAFRTTRMSNRWGMKDTIEDYRRPLTNIGLPPWPIELERLRFDFFHGEFIADDDPQLALLTELGRRIDEYGVPTVVYWTRPPKQRGEMHFPGEFEEHVRSQLAIVERALLAECTSITHMLEVELEDEDYEDSPNATEHFRHSGRVKYADAVAAEIERLRAERAGRDGTPAPTAPQEEQR